MIAKQAKYLVINNKPVPVFAEADRHFPDQKV
jgi:hypothetical protein